MEEVNDEERGGREGGRGGDGDRGDDGASVAVVNAVVESMVYDLKIEGGGEVKNIFKKKKSKTKIEKTLSILNLFLFFPFSLLVVVNGSAPPTLRGCSRVQ